MKTQNNIANSSNTKNEKKIYCITTNSCVVHINASSKKMALCYQQLNMPNILNEFGKKLQLKTFIYYLIL